MLNNADPTRKMSPFQLEAVLAKKGGEQPVALVADEAEQLEVTKVAPVAAARLLACAPLASAPAVALPLPKPRVSRASSIAVALAASSAIVLAWAALLTR